MDGMWSSVMPQFSSQSDSFIVRVINIHTSNLMSHFRSTEQKKKKDYHTLSTFESLIKLKL
jgi:hypothetical protein